MRWKVNHQFSRSMTNWASESLAAHIGCAWWLNQYMLITLSAGNWCRQWRATQGRLLFKEFLKCTFSKLRRAESMCQWWMIAEKGQKQCSSLAIWGFRDWQKRPIKWIKRIRGLKWKTSMHLYRFMSVWPMQKSLRFDATEYPACERIEKPARLLLAQFSENVRTKNVIIFFELYYYYYYSTEQMCSIIPEKYSSSCSFSIIFMPQRSKMLPMRTNKGLQTMQRSSSTIWK